jgi:2'-5' RNA ligase
MFVWIGCKLPQNFEQEIRSRCLERNQGIGLDTAAFSLPQHISLKISFETRQPEAVLEDLAVWLGEQAPFTVHVGNPEQAGKILWLPIAENPDLKRLHQQLDQRLEEKFGIVQHPFDKAFLFHSTLFMDEDPEKIAKMRQLLEKDPMEQELQVDTFLLGLSETGKPGSYRVVRQIKV